MADEKKSFNIQDLIKSIGKRVGKKGKVEIARTYEYTTERKQITVDDWRLIELDQARHSYYKDFDDMDTDVPELSSAIDVYADFVVSSPFSGDESSYEVEFATGVSDSYADLVTKFEERLDLKESVWFLVRDMCKYGDSFYEIVATEDEVVKLKRLDVSTVFVNIKNNKVDKDKPYYQEAGTNRIEFAPWEILHFKVGGDVYGVENSILAKARRIYRLIRMLEDTILVTRLSRSTQRGVYKVDVTGMSENEAAAYIRKLKLLNRRKVMFDSKGKLRADFNPLSETEDIYIPVRKGGGGDFQIVGGETHLGEIRDIEYFQNKLFTATRVPKALLGLERDVNAKATLVQQNVSFLRMVKRYRTAFAKELKRLYLIEFFLHGEELKDDEWQISFPSLFVQDELVAYQTQQVKLGLVGALAQLGVSVPAEWAIRFVGLNLSPDEMDELVELIKKGGDDLGTIGGQQPDLSALLGMAGGAEQPKVPKGEVPTETLPTEDTMERIGLALRENKKLMRELGILEKVLRNRRVGLPPREYY